MTIEKECLRVSEGKMSVEEFSRLLGFSFCFYLDREGNVVTIAFIYHTATKNIPSDKLLRKLTIA